MATSLFTATQLLRPASPLLRNPIIAGALGTAIKAQNRYDDPYAVAKAIGSLGEGYDAMNKSLVGGITAQRATELEDAYRSADFYPAAAEAATSGALYTGVKNRRDIGGIQDIQQAFQAAREAGLTPNTPEFSIFMHDHLTTARGVGENDKTYQTARQQLQLQAFERKALKQGLQQHFAQQYAQDYYNQHLGDVANQFATGPEQEAARKRLNKEAWTFGKQRVQQDGVEPFLDSTTQTWKARDAQGNEMDIPTPLAAQMLEASGIKGPWSALLGATRAQDTRAAQERAAAVAASQIALRGAQADRAEYTTTGQPPAGKGTSALHPYTQALLKIADDKVKRAENTLDALRKPGAVVDPAEITAAEKRVMDAEEARMNLLRQAHGITTPVGPAVGTGAGLMSGRAAMGAGDVSDTTFPGSATPALGATSDVEDTLYPELASDSYRARGWENMSPEQLQQTILNSLQPTETE